MLHGNCKNTENEKINLGGGGGGGGGGVQLTILKAQVI